MAYNLMTNVQTLDPDVQAGAPPNVDPVRLEVLRHTLGGIAEEIWVTIKRTAYSLTIKERGDCSSGIFDQNGQMLALPLSAVPIHQGSLEGLVREIIKRHSAASMRPGDMFLTNDPYQGGTHTPDMCLVAPVFKDGRDLAGFVANLGHHADVGGRVACSIAADSQSIFEEGLIIPPVRLCRAGTISEEVVDILCRNSRAPSQRNGDIRAQIMANQVGIRRLEHVLTAMSLSEWSSYCEALLASSEHRLRAVLRALPDGQWEAEDWLDGDGAGGPPVRLRLILIKERDNITFDWSDVPPQFRSARNVPLNSLTATCFAVLRGMLDPELTVDGGVQRTVTFIAPAGSCVNPTWPAAVGDRATPCQVLADTVVACIGQMVPDRAMAGNGCFQAWAFEGVDPRTGEMFANYESIAGGLGATRFSDGMDAVRGWPLGSMNPPVEALEQEVPVIVRRYELASGSGGDGQYRGGLGMRRDIEILGKDVRVTSYAMRQVVPPPGALGGLAGARGRFILNPETPQAEQLPVVISNMAIPTGAILRCETPGGGGLGLPSARDPQRRACDVLEERVTL